jgi:hypothetical protein
MRRFPSLLLTLALAGHTGCTASSAAPGDQAAGTTTVAGQLAITSARPNVAVTNRGTTLVRLFLIDANVQPLALWAPCDSTCIGVPPGQTVLVPMTAAVGYSDRTTEMLISWWQFTPGPNDRVDATMTSARLRLD